MKKECIVVVIGRSKRLLCTHDLKKMYYIKKKKTPKLPKYLPEIDSISETQQNPPRSLIDMKDCE